MAARILLLGREFSRTAVTVRYKEQRIVAEATIALARMQYRAAPLALGDQRIVAIRIHECRNAMERSTSIVNAFERGKQFIVVGLITCVTRVTRGVHARRAIERIDGKT